MIAYVLNLIFIIVVINFAEVGVTLAILLAHPEADAGLRQISEQYDTI